MSAVRPTRATVGTAIVLGIIGLMVQGLAAILAGKALHDMGVNPRIGGRTWALTGLCAALVCGTLTGLLLVMLMLVAD
jgi:hypothetical protein